MKHSTKTDPFSVSLLFLLLKVLEMNFLILIVIIKQLKSFQKKTLLIKQSNFMKVALQNVQNTWQTIKMSMLKVLDRETES